LASTIAVAESGAPDVAAMAAQSDTTREQINPKKGKSINLVGFGIEKKETL